MDTSLKTLLKEEIAWYAAGGTNLRTFLLSNEDEAVYAVNIVDSPKRHQMAGVVVLARLQGDQIIIEEDSTDKPLYKRLMERGIPREQLILTYAGESPSPLPA
jgi:hypothetical protein